MVRVNEFDHSHRSISKSIVPAGLNLGRWLPTSLPVGLDLTIAVFVPISE